MKFLECYIENFGKLSQFKLEFTEGLNVVLRDNGFGKTTFASFLQAMFYGLDSGRGKDSDRKKFEPWQGGKFGGSLKFTVNGKTYRMERFFGKKEKDDTFALYNAETDLLSSDYTENIGCEIFGIDKESYGKSAYIPQGKVETELSKAGDINAKLSDLLEADNDLASFDDALERLKKLKNKYKRSGGLIGEKELAKSRLESEKERAESLTETERELKARFYERKNSRDSLNEKIEKLHLSAGKAEKAEHYKTIKKAAEISEQAIAEYEKSIKKVPDDKKLKELYDLTENYKNAKSMQQAYSLTAEESLSAEKLASEDFLDFSKEVYEEIMRAVGKYNAEKAVMKSAALTKEENERLNYLKNKYSDNFDEAYADKMYYRALRANEMLENGKAIKKTFVPYVFSAILLIIGFVLFFAVSPFFGLIPIITGLLLAVIYTVLNSIKQSKIKSENEKAYKAMAEAEEFFESYGENFEGNGEKALRNIKMELGEISSLELKKKNSEAFEKNSEISELKVFLAEKAKHYLGRELYTEECEKAFTELFFECKKIEEFKKKKENFEKAAENTSSAYLRLRERAGVYADFEPEKAYEELNVLVAKLNEEKKSYEQKLSALKDFVSANGIPEETEEKFNMSELEALKAASEDITEEMKALEKRIAGVTEETEKIPELTAELSEVTEEIDMLKKKASLVDKAEEALKTAKENLAAKYLGPLGEKFSKFKAVLSAPENARLDAELNVGVIEGGEKHSADSYSTGLKDVMAIALRFALVEALFENEKPVVMLDDPFTNLDESRIKGAKKILEILSEEYQILYLTCHESRS